MIGWARITRALVLAAGAVAALASARSAEAATAPPPETVAAPLAAAARPPAPFARAMTPRSWSFPRDHGAHPDFQTEWWYYTGHLRTPDGRSYGYELVFFRRAADPATGLPPGFEGWQAATFYPAHCALTDETGRRFLHDQRLRRGLGGLAGADTSDLRVWCGDWRVSRDGSAHALQAAVGPWKISLDLAPLKPPVRHGSGGLSRKGPRPGQASYYYSITRMATHGTLTEGSRETPVTGTSWMDHEFFSADLDTSLSGWDWFSVQLDDDTELMLYRLRSRAGPGSDWLSGTSIGGDGAGLSLQAGDFAIQELSRWTSPRTDVSYPAAWRISVPALKLELSLTPTLADQELDARGSTGVIYWEGSVLASGTRGGAPVRGRGYVELTGYDGRTPLEAR